MDCLRDCGQTAALLSWRLVGEAVAEMELQWYRGTRVEWWLVGVLGGARTVDERVKETVRQERKLIQGAVAIPKAPGDCRNGCEGRDRVSRARAVSADGLTFGRGWMGWWMRM